MLSRHFVLMTFWMNETIARDHHSVMWNCRAINVLCSLFSCSFFTFFFFCSFASRTNRQVHYASITIDFSFQFFFFSFLYGISLSGINDVNMLKIGVKIISFSLCFFECIHFHFVDKFHALKIEITSAFDDHFYCHLILVNIENYDKCFVRFWRHTFEPKITILFIIFCKFCLDTSNHSKIRSNNFQTKMLIYVNVNWLRSGCEQTTMMR